MDLREIEWKDMYWIHVAQDRGQRLVLVNMVLGLRVPQTAGNFLTS